MGLLVKVDLDDTLFEDAKDVDAIIGNNELRVLYNEDVETTGDYKIGFTVKFTDYPLNIKTSDVFTVTIVDPCDEPTSIISVLLFDQEYTIT